MVSVSSHAVRVRSLRSLLEPLLEPAEQCAALSAACIGTFEVEGVRHELPRFVFSGPAAEHAPIKLGLFGGVHGDEPAGALTLVSLLGELVRDPSLATGYELAVFPVCNPYGYEHDLRENAAGLDLNREFWRGSVQPEVRFLEQELRGRRLDGLIALHADDTSDGIYGYAHGRVLNEALLRPALAAASSILPLNSSGTIDGFEAAEGIICRCFQGVLSAPPDQQPRPFDVIFETPARAPLELQHRSGVVALESMLTEYRRFLAYGQHL